jgi:amino acid adenylation domain-containing protein
MERTHPQLLLHEHFAERARALPEGIALFEGDRSITFADLDAAAEQLAWVLRSRRVGPGSSVGLHLERSVDWVIGMLGILKADAAVVPLPPAYPVDRLQEILDFAELHAVVDGAASPLDPALGVTGIRFSEASPAIERHARAPSGHPDQPAFVLCSSGSTGRPKMIVRSHRSFFHRLQWTWEKHPFEEGEVGCQKAHMTTTHSIYELFEPLLKGAPGVIIPDQDVRNLERFWDIVRDRGVSRLLIVPSALRASLDMPGFSAPPLEVLVLMGEYVDPVLAERTLAAFAARTRTYSIYGSTEASSTLVCDLRESLRPGEELPLGTPISSDVTALVLGPDLEPVTPGEAGRLYMRGTALFTGYLGDPTLTDSVFVDVPGHTDPLYDTKDEVRSMPDGGLEFVGRADHTVKIRGFRVDLLEVERAMLSHPEVSQAAVVVNESDSGTATLAAFYAPASVDRSTIFDEVRRQLPAYMVPSTLVGLDALPRTDSAKVDRSRLLEELAATASMLEDERTTSETERQVREAWEQTIGHGSFGRDDSFFEVGGDSLSLFSLLYRLRKTFGLEAGRLAEQSVYGSPSIGELAARIDDLLAGGPQRPDERTPLLVTLRRGADTDRPPFFLISSAGGTLGAYERLCKKLTTRREVLGVRDPFNWGERDPTEGFQHWVDLYLEAIRERQPQGPYYVGAYSSAGAFGLEVAHRLRRDDQEVALLVLMDPLALDRGSQWRYGHWALRATYARPAYRRLIRLAGWLRVPAVRMLSAVRTEEVRNDDAWSAERVRKITEYATRNREYLITFSMLLELNTGLPFALSEEDFAEAEPSEYMSVLLSQVKRVMPEIDLATIERIAVQYQLQVRAQHAYRLSGYDGKAWLVEPVSRYAGILEALLRPYIKNLEVRTLEMGSPSDRTALLTSHVGSLEAHYRSMRDDTFVQALARELDTLLG